MIRYIQEPQHPKSGKLLLNAGDHRIMEKYFAGTDCSCKIDLPGEVTPSVYCKYVSAKA
jgi:hypothetical protein